MVIRICRILAIVPALLLALLCWSAGAAARDVVVASFDGTPILTHFYPAATSGPGERAPTVLVGPPWASRGDIAPDQNGGDRIGIANLRNDGFNVVTWDPRGFGGSGGLAMFDSPAFEGRDVQALVDYVATQPDALLDAPGDPRVGMSGSSYGGGIQFVAAAIEPRLDAIVPDISWHSLATSVAKDGAFKAGWMVQICAHGEVLGSLDGVTDGLTGPTGAQLGSIDPQMRSLCLEGNASGTLSAASAQWLGDRVPAALVDRIRAPALITQGTVDTLFPPGEAIASYERLRANGVPVKMLWYCGGHGTCLTPAGDPTVLGRAGLAWLRRWLKRDDTVATGPRFEWVDDDGVWRSGPDYPLAPSGTVRASGLGSLTLHPSVNATLAPVTVATPVLSALEIRYGSAPVESDIVGEPTVTLTYQGIALPASTFLYAQVIDAKAQRVLGGQVTPIPVLLDGLSHTITRKLEVIALRGHPASDLRLQLLPSAALYGPQRSAGSVSVPALASSLPLVDATRSGR